jgi:molybdopterin-guanine dinucleotide biosynthesis protein A
MIRSDNVSGVILAGGQSSRMGQDKALLEIGGKPLIRRLADLLLVLSDDVVISTNADEHYAFLNLPAVADVFPGQGPMAGIHAAMARTPRPLLLVLACDMPRVHLGLLRHILDAVEGYDAAVPATANRGIHPLCAVYRTACSGLLEQSLVRRTNGMRGFLQHPSLRVRHVSSKPGVFSDSDLCNLNDYNDLSRFLGEESSV